MCCISLAEHGSVQSKRLGAATIFVGGLAAGLAPACKVNDYENEHADDDEACHTVAISHGHAL